MTLLGIDVSRYQGAVDWFAVARGGVRFAFAKATEGNTWVDPTFAHNWSQIREAGLFRGTYHFGRPGRDAETQATHFASIVGPLGFLDLPPVLDLEEDDGHPAVHVLNWARAFTTKAEALFGRKLIIYTGNFWRESLGSPIDPFFAERPLWLAAYVKNPVVPKPWNDWTFWQYSEGQHNGPVAIPGVRPCDQNRFLGSELELRALCSVAPPATRQPDPPVLPGNQGDAPEWPGVFFVWPHSPAVSGAMVKQWQQRMVNRGFDLSVDGAYGPQSKAACMALQKNAGLSVDGIVGPRTWKLTFAD